MEKLNLELYIDEEGFLISLTRFHVGIYFNNVDTFQSYKMIISDNQKSELVLNFYSLPDALIFTQDIVKNSFTLSEIAKVYNEQFMNWNKKEKKSKEKDLQELVIPKTKRKVKNNNLD